MKPRLARLTFALLLFHGAAAAGPEGSPRPGQAGPGAVPGQDGREVARAQMDGLYQRLDTSNARATRSICGGCTAGKREAVGKPARPMRRDRDGELAIDDPAEAYRP